MWKNTITSPSVCAGGTWTASIVSPFRWNERDSANVTSGRAIAGEAGDVRLKSLLNCSTDIRLRTFSCATRTAPAFPRFSFPPTWSPCQCVFTTKRIGLSEIAATAVLIFSVIGAYWSSTRKTPSGPAETPTLPPAPVSIQTPSATFCAFTSTFE